MSQINEDPLVYLRDRVVWSDEAIIRKRLRTHLLDYDTLARASYEVDGQPLVGEALVTRLTADFEGFLEQRASLVAAAAECLANGQLVTLEQLGS